MKTIMLCLNQLGIGGIETAVLNQTIQLIKRGYRVLILSKDGIYREKFEEEGAIFLPTEYSMKDTKKAEKVEKIKKWIEEYNVEQVHIHQFECIDTVFWACQITKTPYVAYLHNSITGTYKWYEQALQSYNTIFPLYFRNAEKIIYIKEKTKIENQEKFNIDSEKYKKIKNSIDFEKFKIEGNQISQKIEKFLIISRLTSEKEISIINAIKVFKEYYKTNNNAKLTIVGDGASIETIKNEIKGIENVTQMLGARNDIAQIMAQNDIVIALDRCILEAITMKKIAVISGYERMAQMIVPENIALASENNFNGDNLTEKTIEDIVETIKKLTPEEIKEIVEKNYEYAQKELNINKNLYLIEKPEEKGKQIDIETAISIIIDLEKQIIQNVEYTDKVYKDCKENQKWFEEQIKNRDNELEKKRKENEEKEQEITELKKEIEQQEEKLREKEKTKKGIIYRIYQKIRQSLA